MYTFAYMQRVKIQFPEVFSFSTEITVRITDINYGGHVGNDVILSMLHEVRLQFLKHHGYSEMDLGGCGMIMADVAIEFKNEAFYGEVITASVSANDFHRISFNIFYKLEKETDGKKLTVAVAKTGMVCYNYNQKKICTIPAGVEQKLNTTSKTG